MRSKLLPVLLVLLPMAFSVAAAQSPESSKHADIVRLLRLTGAAQGANQAYDLMLPSLKISMPQVPEQVWQDLRLEVRDNDMIELTYEIWNKHFTQQEIRDLIRFYETPTGQKIAREMPAIQQEMLAAGQKWGNRILERILARLREKGYQIPPNLQ
jgi:hypothetical protein